MLTTFQRKSRRLVSTSLAAFLIFPASALPADLPQYSVVEAAKQGVVYRYVWDANDAKSPLANKRVVITGQAPCDVAGATELIEYDCGLGCDSKHISVVFNNGQKQIPPSTTPAGLRMHSWKVDFGGAEPVDAKEYQVELSKCKADFDGGSGVSVKRIPVFAVRGVIRLATFKISAGDLWTRDQSMYILVAEKMRYVGTVSFAGQIGTIITSVVGKKVVEELIAPSKK